MNPQMNHTNTSLTIPPRSSFYKHRKKSALGFSLIELLVVVGILGILVTLVLQALGDSKSSSIEAQIRGSLKGLNQAHTRAYLIGDPGIPLATDPTYVNDPELAVQWYIDNGYLNLPDFDENVLNYIEIRPLTVGEIAAKHDPINIWKRKP
jgi:prepilin-type N-terminal cleavage/methylation domain-containing protein